MEGTIKAAENKLKAVWPQWEITNRIGKGSSGEVFRIERELFGEKKETAALKIISIPQDSNEIEELRSEGYDDHSITVRYQGYLQDIMREYQYMAELRGCTNIVHVSDLEKLPHDDGIGWDVLIRMELLTPLSKTNIGKNHVSDSEVLRLGIDLCRALVACEGKRILHRDIKPQNVFLAKDGTGKLGDFGIAKVVESTTGGTKTGTYRYMAPEVYNNQPYGHKADQYSLGLVLYWLLNERRGPFEPLPPATPSSKDEDNARARRMKGAALPPPRHSDKRLKEIVLKACAYDPKDRYRTAAEMLQALEALQYGYTPTQAEVSQPKAGMDNGEPGEEGEEDKTESKFGPQKPEQGKSSRVTQEEKPGTNNGPKTPIGGQSINDDEEKGEDIKTVGKYHNPGNPDPKPPGEDTPPDRIPAVLIAIAAAALLIILTMIGIGSCGKDEPPSATPTPTPAVVTPTPKPVTVTPTPTLPSTSVAISSDYFPDEVFRNYLSSTWDKDQDGVLTLSEREAVDKIAFESEDLQSLKGIEFFPFLEHLDIGRPYTKRALKELDISNNIYLTYLDCSYCQLDKIDFSNNGRLEHLALSNNNLQDLDVSNLVNLTVLWCSNNKLSQLDIANNTKLSNLACEWNNLISLDISKNTSLKRLECRVNKIENIDLRRNTELEHLEINNNNLGSLDLSQNKKLNYLNCVHNQLTALDLHQNTSLQYLYCDYNQITTLDLHNNINIMHLYCGNQPLSSLNITGLTRLMDLSCISEVLKSIDISSSPYLIDAFENGTVESEDGLLTKYIRYYTEVWHELWIYPSTKVVY